MAEPDNLFLDLMDVGLKMGLVAAVVAALLCGGCGIAIGRYTSDWRFQSPILEN